MTIAKYVTYFTDCEICGERGSVDELSMYNAGFETPEDYFKSIGWDESSRISENPTICPNCAGFISKIIK